MAPNIPINLIRSYGALLHLMPRIGDRHDFHEQRGNPCQFPETGKIYNTAKQLDIILKIRNFRGDFFISSKKQSLIVLMYRVFEYSCSATDVVYNTFLILINFHHVFCRPHSFYHSLGHYLLGFK